MKQCMDEENLHRRLRKIIGQVQAIDRMIEEDIPCEDVITQVNAAKSALHGEGKYSIIKHWYPVICHHFYESEQTGAGAYLVLRGEYFCIL